MPTTQRARRLQEQAQRRQERAVRRLNDMMEQLEIVLSHHGCPITRHFRETSLVEARATCRVWRRLSFPQRLEMLEALHTFSQLLYIGLNHRSTMPFCGHIFTEHEHL
ncbi:hypothetical protein CFAM422_008566 [Trichoderma lentiforme]|uniref:Uncharacterized protein n=1 Tax=Trichoderma lentiforme TaxID=1567552 RepID=A0A9P4XBQ2_9HYPO|nr:hypothetical protein CFAM422_008566 [Trichoderma lentiforme]